MICGQNVWWIMRVTLCTHAQQWMISPLHENSYIQVEIRAIHVTWKVWGEVQVRIIALRKGDGYLGPNAQIKNYQPHVSCYTYKEAQNISPSSKLKNRKMVVWIENLECRPKILDVGEAMLFYLYLTSNKIFKPEVCLHVMWALLTNVLWLQA